MTPNLTLDIIAFIVDCAFCYLIFYAIFLVVRGIFRFFKRLFSDGKNNNGFPRIDRTFWPPSVPATNSGVLIIPTPEEKYPYEKQDYLLTRTELKFYRVLKPICDERNLDIFAKVRLEDLVTVPQYVFNNWKWRGYIRSRHIDFVLCDASNLKIRCGLELDDWHHNSDENHEIDERKDKIMRDAGLPLIRVKVASMYDTTEINQLIQNNIFTA